MKAIALAALAMLFCPLALAAESATPIAGMAAELTGLKTANPNAHRILADGTFDSMPLEEQLVFSERLVFPEPLGYDADHAEFLAAIRESAKFEAGLLDAAATPAERAEIEAALRRSVLRNIELANDTAWREQTAEELADAPVPTEEELFAKMDALVADLLSTVDEQNSRIAALEGRPSAAAPREGPLAPSRRWHSAPLALGSI